MRNPTWRYIILRLLQAIPLVFGVVTINFIVIHLAPGDPINVLIGDYPAPQEYVQKLRGELGLDRPVYEQYSAYLSSIARGNLGFSFRNRQPVARLILERIPGTFLLSASAMVFAALVGVLLGVAASLRPHSLLDFLSTTIAVSGYSMPVFWLGQVLIMLLAVQLKVLPVQGMTSIREGFTGIAKYGDIAWHLVLPACVLSFSYLAINTRITRAAMLEALQNDFITTARAKGLPWRVVVWRHSFRNALLPIVTVIGLNFGYVLSGSVLVETVFAWPGIGRLLFLSLSGRDYPVILGIFIVASMTAILANLMTDILYSFLDPRIRY
jgi:peptide/nickel transport system permease protein